MGKKIIITVLILVLALAIYVSIAIKKLEYDFEIKSYKPIRINATEGGVISVLVSILIKNPLFFNVPIQALYYEVFYKDSLLGKSADFSNFNLKAGETTTVNQSVELNINKTTLQVAKNYILKQPTDFTAKVYVKFLGISIRLTKIKFTY